MNDMSIADAMALRGDNGGMNGGWGGDFFLVILFLFLFGNNGFGQHGFGGSATAAAQNEILLGQQFEGVHTKLDSIGKGICDSTYALNNSIKECCCSTQLGMKDIAAGIHAEGEATRALIQTNQIQDLRDKVTDLSMGLSQCRQNEYLVGKLTPPCPVPAYQVPSPYCCYNPCGFGNGYQPNI